MLLGSGPGPLASVEVDEPCSGEEVAMDPIQQRAETIARMEVLEKEVVALRRLLAFLAKENGGGLTIDRAALEQLPVVCMLESWEERKTGTFHIRVKA
jgi:hypothetical protein